MTVDEWRRDKDLTSKAAQLLGNPDLRMMLDALRASHLSRYTCPGDAMQKAFHLCHCEGYLSALNDIEAMGRPSVTLETPEASFERDERELITEPQ